MDDAFDTGRMLHYAPAMHIGIDWCKEITEEAKACGCNEPWLHASNSLHKSGYDLNCAGRAFIRAVADSLPGPLARFFRRSA